MQAHTARSASMEISMTPAVSSRLCVVFFSSSSSCRIRFASVLSICGARSKRAVSTLLWTLLSYLKSAEGQPQVPHVGADPHRAAHLYRDVDLALACGFGRQPKVEGAFHIALDELRGGQADAVHGHGHCQRPIFN